MTTKTKIRKRQRYAVTGTITLTIEADGVLAYDEKDARERVVAAVAEATPGGRAGKDKRTYIGIDVYGPLDGGDVQLDAYEEEQAG